MSTLQLILLVIVAAIAGMGSVLDSAQTHRPLVACTLVGLVLGDLPTGIILGGTLEMLALGWMNVGAAMAPDAALASVISAVLVIVGKQSIGAGIAVAVPIAAAGQVLTICRKWKYKRNRNMSFYRIIASSYSCSYTSCYSWTFSRNRCSKCNVSSNSRSNNKRITGCRWIYSSCWLCNGN